MRIFLLFLLTILLLLTSILSNAENKIMNKTQYNLDSFIKKCCKELNIDSCMIVVQPTKYKIYGQYDGVMMVTTKTIYIIQICDEVSFTETLNIVAHELVHVKQYVKGEIPTDKINFEQLKKDSGNEYNKHYEVEARTIGNELYFKYNDYKPTINNN